MTPTERKRDLRKDLLLAGVLVVGGLTISGVSLAHLVKENDLIAQAQTTPSIPAGRDNGPAQAEPGGARPTTPAPEPARPDAEAQKAGATPALPAAPAEKVAPPMNAK